MICHHRTDAADEILRDGFRDATGSYGFATRKFTGVWLADVPLGINEGLEGDFVIRVEFPDDVDLSEFEQFEEAQAYRVWDVPADVINANATRKKMEDHEVEEAEERWLANLERARDSGKFNPAPE